MTLLILIGRDEDGEQHVLVTEDAFEEAMENPFDFFIGVDEAEVAGRVECEGDTSLLSGSYTRD